MKTITSNTVNVNLITKISQTKGRFFGLYLTNGEVLNAQFRSQTDAFIKVYDRKTKNTRLLKKTSVAHATV
jgi:hypothetical protein